MAGGALGDVNARRDIIFIDQRGTGRSHPLECEIEETSLAATFEQSQQLDRLNACLKSLSGDLRQYATWIAVRDFDAVRAKLGYGGQGAKPIDPHPDYLDDDLLQSVISRGPIYRRTPTARQIDHS